MSASYAAPTAEQGDLLDLIAAVPFLANLPEKVYRALADVAHRRRYAAGGIVFLEGETTAGLFLVESGSVKIVRHSKDGREYIVHIMYRGDTFNDVSAMDGGPNPATAIGHTDAVLWRFDRADLRALAIRHPELAWSMMESIACRARYLVSTVQDLAMRSVRGRLARLLLDEAEHAEHGAAPRLLTQEEMAGRLGTVREVVGRALRSLAAEGIIEFDRHRIAILDPDRLAAEADI